MRNDARNGDQARLAQCRGEEGEDGHSHRESLLRAHDDHGLFERELGAQYAMRDRIVEDQVNCVDHKTASNQAEHSLP
eukprot:scaffold107001_cov29-Tisochrysis_lutea.AAC.1